jgi:hypothetical protein
VEDDAAQGQILNELRSRPAELLLEWHQVLQVLQGDLERRASLKTFDRSDPENTLGLQSWNSVGTLAVLLGQSDKSEELFEDLLQLRRGLQPTYGRIHKGTPFHQIGRAKLVMGQTALAREYFTYAAIEDLIRDRGDVDSAMQSPASQTLRVQFGYTRASFKRLADLIPEDDGTQSGRLKYANPELIVLADVDTVSIADPNAPDNGL